MAIWKDQPNTKPSSPPPSGTPEPTPIRDADIADISRGLATSGRPAERELKESLIAAELTIEGKIEGAGHVRIAGKFKGDVNVQGNLTIEQGAKLTGGVRAQKVIVAGELEGNIESAQRVELLDSGVMTGDLKAGSLTVAAGSRMRGQVEFGWEDKAAAKPAALKVESGSSA